MIIERTKMIKPMRNTFLKLISVCLLVACALPAQAQQGYEVLANPQRTANPEKIEVIEFFWYGCPHCFQFEPHISEWLKTKPENVEFIAMAPPLNPAWKVHSQAFYAAEVLGILDQFHEAMFNAIHKDRKQMRKPQDVVKLVDSLGLDGEKFGKTMKSFNVDAKIRQSIQKAKDMGISGVPAVIVNGKYTTSGSLAGSYPQLIAVLNQLVEKETGK